MSSKAKTLAKGSTLRMATFFIDAFIALLLMPFILRSLGDSTYGLWMVVGSFIGYYWLFDFGLGSAVRRYVSRAVGNNDTHEANVIINTSLFLFIIISACVILASFLIALTGPLLIKNLSAHSILFRKVILIMGASFAFDLPMKVFSNVLFSYLRYDISTLIGLFKIFSRSILIVIFLKYGGGLIALALITLGVNIAGHIATFIFVRKIVPSLSFSVKFIEKKRLKPLFSYSSYTFIIGIADKLRFNIDNFVITIFLGLNAVTLYSIASRLIQYFIGFMSSAINILVPVFSQYEAKGDYEAIREKFLFVSKISCYLSLLVGGLLIIYGGAFIERWVGKQYTGAYPLLAILVVAIVFALMQAPSIQLVFGISKHKFFAMSNLLEGLANLCLSLILVRQFGLIGVALGTAIPMIFIKLCVQPVYICRLIKLNIRRYYFEILIPTILKSLFILVIFWFLCRNIISVSFINLFLLAAASSALFIIFAFFLGFSNEEKRYICKSVPIFSFNK
ncbi:MAG: oligosaccharide flippase family protein [Candidatus Omnitrophota bacterium]